MNECDRMVQSVGVFIPNIPKLTATAEAAKACNISPTYFRKLAMNAPAIISIKIAGNTQEAWTAEQIAEVQLRIKR